LETRKLKQRKVKETMDCSKPRSSLSKEQKKVPYWMTRGSEYKRADGRWRRKPMPENELEYPDQAEHREEAEMLPDRACACRGIKKDYTKYISHSEKKCVGFSNGSYSTGVCVVAHCHMIIVKKNIDNRPWCEIVEDDDFVVEIGHSKKCEECGIHAFDLGKAVVVWHGSESEIKENISWCLNARSKKNSFYLPHVRNIPEAWRRMQARKRERYFSVVSKRMDGLIAETVAGYI
jgi:hypothetical protein